MPDSTQFIEKTQVLLVTLKLITVGTVTEPGVGAWFLKSLTGSFVLVGWKTADNYHKKKQSSPLGPLHWLRPGPGKAQSRNFAFVIMIQPKDRRNAANGSSVDTSSSERFFCWCETFSKGKKKKIDGTHEWRKNIQFQKCHWRSSNKEVNVVIYEVYHIPSLWSLRNGTGLRR